MERGHPIIAVVTRETRLAGLKARWATAKQAAFRLQQAAAHEVEFRRKRRPKGRGKAAVVDEAELAVAAEALADDAEYEDEDRFYQQSLTRLLREIDLGLPLKTVDRGFLPNFDFFLGQFGQNKGNIEADMAYRLVFNIYFPTQFDFAEHRSGDFELCAAPASC